MKKISLICCLALATLSQAFGQQDNKSSAQNPLQFDQQEFRGRFAVMTHSNERSDFYVVDMTRLISRFEKVYFMMLTFKDNRIVSITSDLSQDQMWFKANKIYAEEEIIPLFDQLVKKTSEEASAKTIVQQSEWLEANDKYHQR